MEADSACNVGRSKLPSESSSVSAPRETDPTPAVTRPGAGLTSTRVTRSRAREGRDTLIDPEVEFRPGTGAHRGEENPVSASALCGIGLPTARPSSIGINTTPSVVDRPGNADDISRKAKPIFPLETTHFPTSFITERETSNFHTEPSHQQEAPNKTSDFHTSMRRRESTAVYV